MSTLKPIREEQTAMHAVFHQVNRHVSSDFDDNRVVKVFTSPGVWWRCSVCDFETIGDSEWLPLHVKSVKQWMAPLMV